MENLLIITSKEDLKKILYELILELKPDTKSEKPIVDLINIDTLLEFLKGNGYKVSKSQIYKLTSKKKMPHMKVGNRLLFSRKDVLGWLRTQNNIANICVSRVQRK